MSRLGVVTRGATSSGAITRAQQSAHDELELRIAEPSIGVENGKTSRPICRLTRVRFPGGAHLLSSSVGEAGP